MASPTQKLKPNTATQGNETLGGPSAIRLDMPRVSGELFAFLYGSLVRQLIYDQAAQELPQSRNSALLSTAQHLQAVNAELYRMGERIGHRIADEFLSKAGSNTTSCNTFFDTGMSIANVGLKMFLGIEGAEMHVRTAVEGAKTLANEEESYAIVFRENPLSLFVELPDAYREHGLLYSNILCGVVVGALKMVGYTGCRVQYTKDTLLGDEVNEILVSRKKKHPPM